MSLILDALKRAESERESIRPSAPLPEAAPVLPVASSRRTWVFVTIAAIVAIGLTVLALQRPSRAPAPAVNAPQTIAAPTIPEAVATPVTPIPGSEDVVSLDDLTEPEALNDSVAEPAAPPAAAAAPVAPAPVIVAPALEPAPVSKPAPVVPTSKTLKPLREMPSSYRAEFPALSIQVHSYDADPAARFVRIGGYRYKEGEALAEGPRLLEIVNRGLVLEYRGERVIYPLD